MQKPCITTTSQDNFPCRYMFLAADALVFCNTGFNDFSICWLYIKWWFLIRDVSRNTQVTNRKYSLWVSEKTGEHVTTTLFVLIIVCQDFDYSLPSNSTIHVWREKMVCK